MVEREYVWTDEALAEARRLKVALDEVDDALHAPPGLRFERLIGDLLLIVIGDGRDGPGDRHRLRGHRAHDHVPDLAGPGPCGS